VGAVDIFDVNVYHASFDSSEQTLELFTNGEVVASTTGVQGESCQGQLYLGRPKDVGRIEGYIYEVVIYDRALAVDERDGIVNYLRDKWRTVWSPESSAPSEIAGLWGWWQADQGTIVQTGGVAFWSDQSGRNLTMGQSIVDRRPQLVPDARNGLPGLAFDDENDHLENLTDTLDFAVEDATVFVVMETSDSIDAAPIGSLDGPTGTGRAWFENEFGYGNVYIGGFPAPLSVDGGAVTGPAILTVFFSRQHGVTQYAVNEWIWGMQRDVIGETNPDGGTRIGDTKSDVNDFNGIIYEVVVFSRQLNWAERRQVVNYLNGRWSIF
jgi:hypothetical protein